MISGRTAILWAGQCVVCRHAAIYDTEVKELAHAEDQPDDHLAGVDWEVTYLREVRAASMDEAARLFAEHNLQVFTAGDPIAVWVTLDQNHVIRAGLTPNPPGMWVAVSPDGQSDGTDGQQPGSPIGAGPNRYQAAWTVIGADYDSETPYEAARASVHDLMYAPNRTGPDDEIEFAVQADDGPPLVHYYVRTTTMAIRTADGDYPEGA